MNSLVAVLNSTFPKSVLICGGASRTWDVQDTVFDIHSARIRERLRQSGILVVNPTDLFDSLPKREDDSWHFRCLSKGVRSYNVVDTTLLSLESLISHVVLIAHHLIESNEAINARGDRSWISCMEAKSASAHLTLAIQYDPREDVLPLSYSRRANERGSGTIDLQSLRCFGIDPACVDASSRLAPSQLPSSISLLRLLAMRLSTVFMTWCSVDVTCALAPLSQLRLSREKFGLKAPLLRLAQMKTY